MQANTQSQTTNLGTSTSETTIVNADPTARNNLIGLIITSLNTVAGVVTIKDSTGGTTRLLLDFPSGAAAQPAFIASFDLPLRQLAGPNNNWTATVSPNATGCKITAIFVKEF